MSEDEPTTRCLQNNAPAFAMIDPKDVMENSRLNTTTITTTTNNNNNNNATTTVRVKSVDMLTENTASTSDSADNGTATTKQTHQIPGNTPQQNPSPTTPINTAHKHRENHTKTTTYAGQSHYTPHRKHE
jgi:hypothetical protein